MPTTKLIHRPMTSAEIKNYSKNLKKAQKVRQAVKKYIKQQFNVTDFYVKVFTESRAGGKCRTKFWLIDSIVQKPIIDFLNEKYPKCKTGLVLGMPYMDLSISITVG